MIFVTVGMHSDGFPRLVETMDRLAAHIDEEVLIQTGSTVYQPSAARWFTFASQAEMEDYSRRAQIIVSHAGAGSILTALHYGKPMIVVPRRQQRGEHIDDHQLELAQALAEAGALIMVDAPEEIPAQLQAALDLTPPRPDSSRLVAALRRELDAEG
jgi:beta-1,4-N-acetylglucosaminyltransferase